MVAVGVVTSMPPVLATSPAMKTNPPSISEKAPLFPSCDPAS